MIQISGLLKYPLLFHAFSSRDDENMANSILGKLTDFDDVLENRKIFFNKIGVNINSVICVWVEGKDRVLLADPKAAGRSVLDRNYAVRCDGLITDRKGLYFFLLIADCLPIIIYDPFKEAVGIIHAGWRGAELGIARKSILKFVKCFKSKPEDLIVGFGPAALKNSYVKENPPQVNRLKWKDFMIPLGNNKYKIDFVGLCKKQLLDMGVNKNNIFESGIDTISDLRFYSHYRDKELPLNKQGRFACVVGIRK